MLERDQSLLDYTKVSTFRKYDFSVPFLHAADMILNESSEIP